MMMTMMVIMKMRKKRKKGGERVRRKGMKERRGRKKNFLSKYKTDKCISVSDFPHGLVQGSMAVPRVITQLCFLWIGFSCSML